MTFALGLTVFSTAAVRNGLAVLVVAWLGLLSAAPAGADPLAERFAGFRQGSAISVDHSSWSALLRRYVVQDEAGLNRVAYARFKRDGHGQLKAYLSQLQQVAVSSLDRPEQFAFWVNLYNALTIDVVLDHYPVESIRDIRLGGLFAVGPWKAKIAVVEGVELSLDDIEHGILRPLWRDPRVHYAVNCASIGCPNLAAQAYGGARLNAMLEAAAKAYVNSPRGARIRDRGLVVSSIYTWYGDDFGGSPAAVLRHLEKYAEPALRAQLRLGISDDQYDWRLNEAE